MMRGILVFLIVTGGLCLAQDTCPEGATTPDKTYAAEFASHKPFVEVRLNGSRPLHFILDTGSPLAGIDSSLVSTLGFRPDAVISRSGGAGESGGLIMRLLPRACEEMGGARLPNGTIMSLDLSQVSRAEGVRVEGILGGDFYRHYVIIVDYQRRTIQVLDPSFEYHGTGLVLPITLEGNHMFTSARLRKASGEYVEGRFMIDTGVRVALLLNAPFAHQSGILHGYKTVPNITFGIGAGGETRGDVLKLDELRWGPLLLRNVIAFASTDSKGVLADTGFDGIIGADLLRRYKLFLDYPHSRIILENTVATDTPFGYDESGMFLVADGPRLDQIKVLRVVHDSPADNAGLRDGDLIVSIDGTEAGRLGLHKIRQMLQVGGRQYSLNIRRGDKSISTALETHDLLTGPAVVPPQQPR